MNRLMRYICVVMVMCAFFVWANPARAKNCVDISSQAGFKDSVTKTGSDKCQSANLTGSIEITEAITANYSDGDPLVITTLKPSLMNMQSKPLHVMKDGSLVMYNVELKDFLAGKLWIDEGGSALLADATFPGSILPIYVAPGGVFACLNCKFEGQVPEIAGTASFIDSDFSGLHKNYATSLIIDSSNAVSVKSSEFDNQGDGEGSFIQVKKSKETEIRGNKFVSTGAPVIKIEGPTSMGVMISGNRFVNNSGGSSIALDGWFAAGPGSPMATMAVPDLSEPWYDDENYMVGIKNTFSEKQAYWGSSSVKCSGTKSRRGIGNARHINIEPYLIMGENLYSLGIYHADDVDSEGLKYIKIPLDKKVQIKKDGSEVAVANGDIAVLVHCEGRGTTNFSNKVKLFKCPDGYRPENGKCIKNKCETIADCTGGKVCIDYECEPCTESAQCLNGEICHDDGKCGPECEKNLDCTGDRQICIDGSCITMECTKDEDCNAANKEKCVDHECEYSPDCLKDEDCDSGYQCLAGECIVSSQTPCSADSSCPDDFYCEIEAGLCVQCDAKAVPKVCSNGNQATLSGGKYYCASGGSAMCPVNSGVNDRCGSSCICNVIYMPDASGRFCLDLDGNLCAPGFEIDLKSQTCVEVDENVGKKGGCSLLLQ